MPIFFGGAFNWDFEDNMVLAAAKRADVDYLVTNDKALIVKAQEAFRRFSRLPR